MSGRDGTSASRLSRLLTISALIVVCAVVIVATFRALPALAPSWWPGRPPLADLVAAVGAQRIVEPRLTGGFLYAPLTRASTRSGAQPDALQAPDVRLAALRIEQRAQTDRGAESLGAFGAAAILTGRTEAGVKALEEAVGLEPKAAKLRSDLAAAYLVRFRQTNQLEDAARAIDSSTLAIELDARRTEARFNLALALEALSLRDEALKAWASFARMDADSAWAKEAEAHVDALAPAKIARRFDEERRRIVDGVDSGDRIILVRAVDTLPDVAYDFVENELLPQWAGAWLAHDRAKADEALRRAQTVGQILAERVGERMPIDAVTAINAAIGKRGDRAEVIAHGHQAFAAARALYQQDRFGESSKPFVDARVAFESSQSPMAEWARLYLVIDSYLQDPPESAARHLAPLFDRIDSRQHFLVLGRALRMRGLLRNLTGALGDSLDDYNRALATFTRIRAREDLASIHSIIAETLFMLGDATDAWAHRNEALRDLASLRIARTRHTILYSCAWMASQRGHSRAALSVYNEMLTDARAVNRAGGIIEAYHARAEVHHRLGFDQLALADLEAATRLTDSLEEQSLAQRHRAELNLARGEILRKEHPGDAIPLLQDSLTYFLAHRTNQRLAELYLALGQAQETTGSLDAAKQAFEAGIEILERDRPLLPTGGVRLSYFDQPWNLYDKMIQLASRQTGQEHVALLFAERSRARDLLERTASAAAVPIDPATASSWVEPDEKIVYFVVLPERLLVWVVGDARTVFRELPLSSAELEARILALRDALQTRRSVETDRLSKELFARLVEPLPDIGSAASIVFIPDGVLHLLPFSALKDGRTGRYLVEDHAIATAPSATMFVRSRDRRRKLPSLMSADVFVVGNPRLSAEDGEGLPDLRSAEVEAQNIASVYPRAVVVMGATATKTSFVREAGEHQIVHFAGHAVANDSYPLLSRLLFARDTDDRSGVLFANELADLDLARTQLVVLAACRTAASAVRKGEGPIGLARPFLSRGVPTVVATLWDVQDDAGPAFFDAFYRSIRSGADPARAIRAAQLALLRQSDNRFRAPDAWAGFVVLGG